MAIQNGIGILSYPRRMLRGLEGQPAKSELPIADTYSVPLVGQISTITIATFDADADAVTASITLPDATVVSETITRAAGVPLDDAAAATALADALNANAALGNHVNASALAAVVTLTFVHPNMVYGVATSVVGCTAVVAQTQAPGGTARTPGRFVSSGVETGGVPEVATLATGADEFAVRGIILRELGSPINAGATLSSAVDQVQPGNLVAVAKRGPVLMRNNGTVATTRGGAVFVVVNPAGGQDVGMARSDDDAANAIEISRARAHWGEIIAPGEIGELVVSIS